MIDIKKEKVISLHDARNLFPPHPQGGRLAKSTLYRWIQKGKDGVVLETIKMGARRCTSVEAVQRFCDALTGHVIPPTCMSSGEAEARRKLKEKGWL